VSAAATARRPRLVHLTTTDMSLDWLLGPQLRAFADAGFEVIGMSAPGPHVAAIERLGIRHVEIPSLSRGSSVRRDGRALVDVRRMLVELRPDILHTHNPKPGVIGRIAGRLAGVPLVVNTQHGLFAQPTDRWRRRTAVYAVERLAAAFGHLELVQSAEDVDTLVDRLRVPARKVRLLGNGIDLERFDPTAVTPEEVIAVRGGWGLSPGDVAVGAIGRLVRDKGVAELLEVGRRLRAADRDVRLVLVGPEDVEKSDAIDAAELVQATAAGDVILAGSRDDMPAVYRALDVVVSASWREGFPRSLMESAAMGRPVVATDVRGNREVVVDGETGILVPARDPAALAVEALSLVGDPDRRAAMGEAARQRAAAEFDQARVISRTLDAYATFGRR